MSYTLCAQAYRDREVGCTKALNTRKTSIGYLYHNKKENSSGPHLHSCEQRVDQIRKKQGWYETCRQKANSLTFIKRVRSDIKPNKSLYSFLPCSFPSICPDGQIQCISILPNSHPAGLSVPYKSPLQKKRKNLLAVIPLPIIPHYRWGNNPMLIIFTINLSFKGN